MSDVGWMSGEFRPGYTMAVSSFISGVHQWEFISGQWGQAVASGEEQWPVNQWE